MRTHLTPAEQIDHIEWVAERLRMTNLDSLRIDEDSEPSILANAKTIKQRRDMRARFRRNISMINYSKGIVSGKAGGFPYAAPNEIKIRNAQKERTREWAEEHFIHDKKGTLIKLADLMSRSANQQFSELFTIATGIQKHAEASGLTAVFITLTAPGHMHPNPSKGKNTWDGTTPRQAHAWIAANWHRVLARLKTEDIEIAGVRVVEPHKDGCPHWHVMYWAYPEDHARIEKIVREAADEWSDLQKMGVTYIKERDFKALAELAKDAKKQRSMTATAEQLEASAMPVRTQLAQLVRAAAEGCPTAVQFSRQCAASGVIVRPHIKKGELSGFFFSLSADPERTEFKGSQIGAGWGEDVGAKFVEIDASKGKATSYLFKYLTKSLSSFAELHGDQAAIDAWRATWGIRAFQFFGIPPKKDWRLFRKLNKAPADARLKGAWYAAKRGDAAAWIGLSGGLCIKRKDRPIKTELETNEDGKFIWVHNVSNSEYTCAPVKSWEIIDKDQKDEIEDALLLIENQSVAVIANDPSSSKADSRERQKDYEKMMDDAGYDFDFSLQDYVVPPNASNLVW